MAKYEVFAAVQIVNKKLGAAFFDTLTKQLFVIDNENLCLDELSLHSLSTSFIGDNIVFRQISANAIVYPQEEAGAYTTKLALSELSAVCNDIQIFVSVDKDEFEFNLGSRRLAELVNNTNSPASAKSLYDCEANNEFTNLCKESIGCAGALLGYLKSKTKYDMEEILVAPMKLNSFMKVDQDTLSYLQIFDGKKHPNMHSLSKYRETTSLFTLLDQTKSITGRNMLRKWLLCPLQSLMQIQERQEALSFMCSDTFANTLKELQNVLSKTRSMRASCLRIQTELVVIDLEAIAQFAYAIVKIHQLLTAMESLPRLIHEFLTTNQSTFVELGCLIIDAIDFDASRASEKIVVASGVSSKIDSMREIFSGLDTILDKASIEMETIARVPVVAVYWPQLGFLSSIEITHFDGGTDSEPHLENWMLKFQTDKQRYYKNSITNALDRSPGDVFSLINDAESELCLELQNRICAYIPEIIRASELAAQIDCLQSLASVANMYGYCRPLFNDNACYHITRGRHPIIEATMGKGSFISNDIDLSGNTCTHEHHQTEDKQRTLVVVGPNASGKSVLAKQAALLVYMAHIGSYVPATKACIGLTDCIVAMGRASESLANRQSALSVDLKIVGNVLKYAALKTLVILDEFGRGTSPVDGIGLLCGVLASMAVQCQDQPACLILTHFQGMTLPTNSCQLPQLQTSLIVLANNQLAFLLNCCVEIMGIQRIDHIWSNVQIKEMQFKESTKGLVRLYRSCRLSDKKDHSGLYAIACVQGAGIPNKILCRAQKLVGLASNNEM
ncbi:hypothetical protein COEREDRAFT_85206 [Coemansia reversa NRRL 1564]|uniref:DNA mismatch repair proteins mutS family domain-containing protein n=1 Tax=Coemansia reversa (strain ATCC 12441 / NRRL 1564) TaxID=763665 RepID=A0A2G5BIE9_COERN|nr:hypothetical protein COEREDRAFT_85206 [Coemansia reversa NRRL 1564]|eukprot:PIA18752.1 hypothetical protein COEREDRAFT_85206 [Coemansia reversa NRRL 1564]